MSVLDDLVDKSRGMIVCVFGRRCDEMTKEELIAVISWLAQQNAQLRQENTRRSIEHVRDLAAMAKCR